MLELKKDLFADIQDEPREHYRFKVDPKRSEEIEKRYVSMYVRGLVFSLIYSVIVTVIGIIFDGSIIGFGVAFFVIFAVIFIKAIAVYKKTFKQVKEKFPNTVYDYALYDDFLTVYVSSDESIRQVKIKLADIKRFWSTASYVVMEYQGQLFLIDKNELTENSYFLSRCKKSKKK
ncbi:MAG: hypothetical protein IJ011_00110 [Clostridia bacterium]|nr:hypothetical protein [Clostridia bacterium]